MPLRTGPTPFFAVSPIWWQALHTPKTFSPAAASWALTSPAPATANSATKTTARILFSCLFGALSGTEIIVLSGGTVDPTFVQPGRRHLSSTTHDQSSVGFDVASLQVRPDRHHALDPRQRHQAESGDRRPTQICDDLGSFPPAAAFPDAA